MNHTETPATNAEPGLPGVPEMRAAEEPQRLHKDMAALRQSATSDDTLEDLTVVARLPFRAVHRAHQLRSAAKKHVWRTAGIAATVGLIAGYGIGGLFL